MPKVVVNSPSQGLLLAPDQKLEVLGDAYGAGMPEPQSIASVTVRLDGNPPIEAALANLPGRHSIMTQVAFSASLMPPQTAPYTHVLTVTATDDSSVSVTQQRTVYVGVSPLNTSFQGMAAIVTDNSYAPGPFDAPVSIALQFDADRRSVTITDCPPIVTTATVTGGITATTTITQIDGGTGIFSTADQSLIMPITLRFYTEVHEIITLTNTSDLHTVLVTGSDQPGPFQATGVPLDSSTGAITLVGDGVFNGGHLNGNNAGLRLDGTITPIP
jgi:hypothetical protein